MLLLFVRQVDGGDRLVHHAVRLIDPIFIELARGYGLLRIHRHDFVRWLPVQPVLKDLLGLAVRSHYCVGGCVDVAN